MVEEEYKNQTRFFLSWTLTISPEAAMRNPCYISTGDSHETRLDRTFNAGSLGV